MLRKVMQNLQTTNVRLIQIEVPVWYTIYYQLPAVKGATNEKRTSMLKTVSQKGLVNHSLK